jgi:hypothetical protein
VHYRPDTHQKEAMNKNISLIFAGAAVIGVALTGCKSGGNAAASSSSLRAAATSSAAKQAEQTGKNILAACVPAKDITESYLVSLALNPTKVHALAVKCNIPKANRKPFTKAVLASALNAYQHGDFKTKTGRLEWANKVFPVIMKTYQAK